MCDQWLRFTVKEHGQKVVHTAAKIRKQWEKLVERVLQHKLVRIVRIPGAHGVAVEDRILVCMVGGSELYEAP